MSSEEIQNYHNGSKRIDESTRQLLGTTFKRQLISSRNSLWNGNRIVVNPKTNEKINICINVNYELFHSIFSIIHNYLPNGELVDLHPIKSDKYNVGYEDCVCYLSDDGLSGFALTKPVDLFIVKAINLLKVNKNTLKTAKLLMKMVIF